MRQAPLVPPDALSVPGLKPVSAVTEELSIMIFQSQDFIGLRNRKAISHRENRLIGNVIFVQSFHLLAFGVI